MIFNLIVAAVFTVAAAQQYTTPVPILKQINKHNEDGSYSYGYEGADGTYKIETKYPDGEVHGKYGYIDDTGKVRSVEYGASKRGFEPTGNEIQVPPPTLNSNPDALARPLGPNEEDDGQYREDPSVYYQNDPTVNNRPRYQQHQQQQQTYRQPAFHNYQQPTSFQTQPAYQPQPAYQQQPAYQSQPAFRPQSNFNFGLTQPRYYNPAPPAYPNYNQFQGHPATNVDINSGSYTVNYRK